MAKMRCRAASFSHCSDVGDSKDITYRTCCSVTILTVLLIYSPTCISTGATSQASNARCITYVWHGVRRLGFELAVEIDAITMNDVCKRWTGRGSMNGVKRVKKSDKACLLALLSRDANGPSVTSLFIMSLSDAGRGEVGDLFRWTVYTRDAMSAR